MEKRLEPLDLELPLWPSWAKIRQKASWKHNRERAERRSKVGCDFQEGNVFICTIASMYVRAACKKRKKKAGTISLCIQRSLM